MLNRGVASSQIFDTGGDFKRFLNLVDYYRHETNISFSKYIKLPLDKRGDAKNNLSNSELRITIYSLCLMPNHFHMLVRQELDDGIKKALTSIENAYGKYFNLKNNRQGPLFQSRFKAKRIENDNILMHVSRYIHLNPCTSYLIDINKLHMYPWSSYPKYTNTNNPNETFINKDFILKIAGGVDNYKKFVIDQADYQRKLKRIKHLLLEK